MCDSKISKCKLSWTSSWCKEDSRQTCGPYCLPVAMATVQHEMLLLAHYDMIYRPTWKYQKTAIWYYYDIIIYY